LQAPSKRPTSQNKTLASSAEPPSSVPRQTAPNPVAALLASVTLLRVARSTWCLQAVARSCWAAHNPRNNLAYCFCCGENFNTIDLMMIQGHDFLPAVDILKNWFFEYQQDLGRRKTSA
jgi:hypothetical protein